MPDRISRLLPVADICIQPDRRLPILAPALRAGANTPPEAPVVKEKTGPAIRSSGIYQGTCLSAVNKVVVISSFPDPSTLSLMNTARSTIIKAQPVTYNTCCQFHRKLAFQRNSPSIQRAIMLPPSPVSTATTITPRKTLPGRLPTSG